VFDQKKRQHTFGDSTGDRSGFTTVLSKVIMVNIEELSEEDQRKYTKLQEYIKHQFLSSAKKDRSSMVTMTQESELSIKVNNDNIEVITTISKPEIDLSTKLVALSDKFKRAFSNYHSPDASMITRLEKVEGSSSFNIPASGTSLDTLVYGMLAGFYLGQSSLPKPTLVTPPPMVRLTA
jgi:hypothetical protein